MVSLMDNNLVVFYYLSASEIWPDKRDGLFWGLQFSSILSSRWILTLAWQDGWPLVKEALKDGYYFILKFLWSNCMQLTHHINQKLTLFHKRGSSVLAPHLPTELEIWELTWYLDSIVPWCHWYNSILIDKCIQTYCLPQIIFTNVQ